MARGYWLLKSEPDAWSYDHHAAAPDGVASWDGVRNYQARNFMRDDMKVGDLALFYHSNDKPPHVAGIVEVVREAYPDPTAFDSESKYYDPKSSPDAPRWVMVDLRAVRKLPTPVPLAAIKEEPALQDMLLVRRGSRLSVMPVSQEHFELIVAMSESATPG